MNLQRANILANLDLPWNPAVLEQRIGRIYRLGQKKKVQVFNFISAYSIEHRILHLLEFKKSVFAGVLDEDGKDQVMMEGFMQSVRDLINVDLDGKESSLPRYNRERDSYNLAAEVNQSYLQEGPGDNRKETNARPKVPGVAQSTMATRGFAGKLRRLIKAVTSVFRLRR